MSKEHPDVNERVVIQNIYFSYYHGNTFNLLLQQLKKIKRADKKGTEVREIIRYIIPSFLPLS